MKYINYRTLKFLPNDYNHNRYNALIVSGTTMGGRIRIARLRKNLSKSELSRKVGTVYQRVHEWESDMKKPTDQYLNKVSEVLEVSTDWLERGVYLNQPKQLYDECSIDIDPISEEQFAVRNENLITAGEILSCLSAETLGKVTTLIRRLYYIDYIQKICNGIPVEDHLDDPTIDLYFESDEENKALEEARAYINDRIETFNFTIEVSEE